MWELQGMIGSCLNRLSTIKNTKQSANSNVGIIELNFSCLNLVQGGKWLYRNFLGLDLSMLSDLSLSVISYD
jgi:hypothetical protein